MRSTWCAWVTHKHTHTKKKITHSLPDTTHMEKYLDGVFTDVCRRESTCARANTHALSEDVITWVSLLSVSSPDWWKAEEAWLVAALKASDFLSLSAPFITFPCIWLTSVVMHLQKFLTNHSLQLGRKQYGGDYRTINKKHVVSARASMSNILKQFCTHVIALAPKVTSSLKWEGASASSDVQYVPSYASQRRMMSAFFINPIITHKAARSKSCEPLKMILLRSHTFAVITACQFLHAERTCASVTSDYGPEVPHHLGSILFKISQADEWNVKLDLKHAHAVLEGIFFFFFFFFYFFLYIIHLESKENLETLCLSQYQKAIQCHSHYP